jgi:predicted amidohydrolase
MKKYARRARCFLLIVLTGLLLAGLSGCATGPAAGKRSTTSGEAGLEVVAVQLAVDEKLSRSQWAFRARMRNIVCKAVRDYQPDLLIFPEYTNVFPALSPYYDQIRKADTFKEALEAIREKHPEIESFKEVFLHEEEAVEEQMQQVWAELARRWELTIVAGTYFAAAGPTDTQPAAPGQPDQPHENEPTDTTELRNRAVVYGPTGSILYYQDKVYLTGFERDILELSPGESRDAGTFPVDGSEVALSICRDTFFDEWELRFQEADLWIDLKANGTRFTEEERSRFQRALPERIAESPVDWGVTVCLTGTYLDLLWEGESAFVRAHGEGVQIVQRSRNPQDADLVYLRISP